MSNWVPRSLRWRLQVWLALLLVSVLTGFGITVYQLERVSHVNQIDGELASRIAALNNAIRNAPFTRGGPARSPDEAPGTSQPAPAPARLPSAKGTRSSEASGRRPPPGPRPPGPATQRTTARWPAPHGTAPGTTP